MVRSSAALLSGILLASCTANDAAIYHKWDMDADKGGSSVIIDAKQRAIISVERNVEKREAGQNNTPVSMAVVRKFCAEPSPDALSAISSSFATALSVGIFGQGEGSGALSSALSEAAGELGRRNATIQLLRDGHYRLCEAYLNESLSPYTYNLLARRYSDQAIVLLAIEQLTPVGSETVKVNVGEGSEVTVNTSATGVQPQSPVADPIEDDQDPEAQPSAPQSPEAGTPPGDGEGTGDTQVDSTPADNTTFRNDSGSSQGQFKLIRASLLIGDSSPRNQVAQDTTGSEQPGSDGSPIPLTPAEPAQPPSGVADSANPTSNGGNNPGKAQGSATARAGSPGVTTRAVQAPNGPSAEVTRAVAYMIGQYLNQSRVGDCLLALDNLILHEGFETVEEDTYPARFAILEGCRKILEAASTSGSDPDEIYSYPPLLSAPDSPLPVPENPSSEN